MQLADYLDNVVVLDAAPSDNAPVQRRLRQCGLAPWSLDLGTNGAWRETLRRALDQARGRGAPGVLVLLSDQGHDAAFWRSQDAVVEHLAARRWDIVYLGHGPSGSALGDDNRPGLVHCDMPPSDVSAIAVRCEVLDLIVQTMPDHGVDGPLSPADWLAIACWLATDRVRSGSGWAVWPPLMHAGHALH